MTVLLESDTVYSFKTKDVKWEGTQEKKNREIGFLFVSSKCPSVVLS